MLCLGDHPVSTNSGGQISTDLQRQIVGGVMLCTLGYVIADSGLCVLAENCRLAYSACVLIGFWADFVIINVGS